MKYTTQQILACLFSGLFAIFLSGAIVTKIYFNHQIQNEVKTVSTLQFSNQKQWAEQPGKNNLTLNKVFSISNLTENGEISSTVDKTYNYRFKYNNISYIPSSEGSVAYFQSYEHVPIDSVSQNINVVNPSLLKGFYEEVHSHVSRKIPIALYELINLMQTSYQIYFSNITLMFGFSDKQVVYNELFQRISLDQATQDKLWSDPVYGWNRAETFIPWIQIVQQDEFDANPNYQMLQDYFSLSDVNMAAIAGQNSYLDKSFQMIIQIIKGRLSSNGLICTQVCQNDVLTIAQWSGGLLTVGQLFPHNPTVLNENLHSFNSSVPNDAEIFLYFQKQGYTDFPIDFGSKFLVMNMDDPTQTVEDGTNTLFSFTTMGTIYANLDQPDIVNNYLQIYKTEQLNYMNLVEYLEFMVTIFTQTEYSTKATNATATFSYMSYKHLIRNINSIQQLISDNLWARSVFTSIQNARLSCEQIFKNELLTPMKKAICEQGGAHTDLNIENSLSANAQFYQAFSGGPSSDAWQILEYITLADIQANDDMMNCLLTDPQCSQYASILQEVQQTISKAYNCDDLLGCDINYLTKQQWSNSYVTLNLPQKYFNSQGNSVNIWAEQDSMPFAPELFAFANKEILTEDQVDSILGGDTNSLKSFFNMHQFILASVDSNIDVQTLFGLEQDQAQILQNYFNNYLINNVFGGKTQQFKIEDILWGFTDSYLSNRQTYPTLFGGQPWESDRINLLKINNNDDLKYYTNYNLTQMNTGIVDIQLTRKYQQVDGQVKIISKYTLFKSESQEYSYELQNNQDIVGCEEFGFKPFLTDTDDLEIYNQEFQLNSKYSYDQEDTKHSYKTFIYSSSEQTSLPISPLRNLNLIGVPYQSESPSGSIEVEPTSGLAVKFNNEIRISAPFIDDLLIDITDSQNYQTVPLLTIKYQSDFSEQLMNSKFSKIHQYEEDRNVVFIVLITLSAACFVFGVGLLVMIYNSHIQFQKDHEQTLMGETDIEQNNIDSAKKPALNGSDANYQMNVSLKHY